MSATYRTQSGRHGPSIAAVEVIVNDIFVSGQIDYLPVTHTR